MAANTNYNINVRYSIQDKASRGIANVGTAARQSSRDLGVLRKGFGLLKVAAVGGFGMFAAKRALLDYNASIEETKLATAGLINLNLGGSFVKSQGMANSLIEKFKQDAKASAGTMQDMAQFSQLIVGPVTRSGLGMGELRDITKGAVVAAKAFGMEADVAARDIEQALAGTAGMKDRFFRAIMEPMGVSTEAWNKMMKETPQKATQLLVKAFNQPALKSMANAYKDTWAGTMSTFKDNLQQALGKIGMPLMRAIVKEAQKLNAWLSDNSDQVEKFAKKAGKALVDGFMAVKDAIVFLVDHRDTIILLGKLFIGMKALQLGKGLVGAASGFGGMLAEAGAVGGKFQRLGGATGVLIGKFASAAKWVGGLAIAAKAGWEIGSFIDKKLFAAGGLLGGPKTIDTNKAKGAQEAMVRMGFQALAGVDRVQPGKGEASQAFSYFFQQVRGARNVGTIAKAAGTDDTNTIRIIQQGFDSSKTSMSLETFAKKTAEGTRAIVSIAQNYESVSEKMTDAFGRMGSQLAASLGTAGRQTGGILGMVGLGTVGSALENYFPGRGGGSLPDKPPTNLNVKINKVEVVSDDPDRVAFGLVGALHKAATKPTRARGSGPLARIK